MTPEQFGRRMEKVAKGVQYSQRDGVNEASLVFNLAVNAGVKRAIGPEQELSGVRFGNKRKFNTTRPEPSKKISGKLLTASSDVKPTAIVKGVPAGMFTIVESGAEPHTVGDTNANAFNIKTRKAVARRVSKKKGTEYGIKLKGRALMPNPYTVVGYGPFKNSGGSTGKKPFASALKTVGPRVAQMVHRQTSSAIVKAFR